MNNSNNTEFRSATEFPKTIQGLNIEEADQLYGEIRKYLVSTNRSQGQLRRHNKKNREELKELRDSTARLQEMIDLLKIQKEQELQEQSETINLLQEEVGSMTGHLDTLSSAFEGIRDFDDPNIQWGSSNFMSRVLNFMKSVRITLQWWNQSHPAPQPTPQLDSTKDTALSEYQRNIAVNRMDNPQEFSDPASINRAIRNDVG